MLRHDPPGVDLHLLLSAHARQAYVETDPKTADAGSIVRNLLAGEYDRPLRVVALNVEEGWSRDVSGTIAHRVRDVAEIALTDSTLAFIEMHVERQLQPTLRCGDQRA